MIMKKILLMGLLSVMLSGCIIDIGGIIDIMTTSSSNNKTSQIISGNSKDKGLTGVEYFKYYSDVSGCKYFPSTGNNKMLVVPVMFKGESLSDSNKVLSDLDLVFNGNESDTGWESVSSFYKESSFNKLNIEADVLDYWITIDKTVKEVANLSYNDYDDPSIYVLEYVYKYLENKIDLKEYDNNSDGFVDGVWLVYGNHSYSNYHLESDNIENLLWAYTYWDTYTKPNVNKPTFNVYCWGSYDFMYEGVNATSGLKLDAHTLIHETGHMLGLDDYYDYDATKNPTGCLDMMDYNIGDHNSYSKWMLGWVEPNVYDYNEGVIDIDSFSDTGEFIVIPSDDKVNYSPLSEYLLIELYTPTGLNKLDSRYSYLSSYPKMFTNVGVRIYHVDSRLGEFVYQRNDWYYNDYIYNYSLNDLYSNTGNYNYFAIFNNNTPSYSYEEDNKLIRLVSAYYGNNYVFSDEQYAANKDLFKDGTSLENFRFNNGKTLDVNIEFEIKNNSLRVYFE